jgi:predicted permease
MTLGELWRRIWYLLNRARIERELAEEMAAHREMMDDPRRFGNLLKLREDSRDAWGWGWLDRARQDARYAVRVLWRAPGFAVVACLILSSGIGLNLTFFHLLNVAVLRPPAVRDPHTLVRFNRRSPTFESNGVPYPATQFIRRHNNVLTAVLTRHRNDVTWGDDTSHRIRADFVSANWFTELGYGAAVGRAFDEAKDERVDVPPVAVISHKVWQTRLHGAEDIVGRTVRVNDRPATVIGVAPAAFPGLEGEKTDVWLLIDQIDYFNPGTSYKSDWAVHDTQLYARLRPGVSPAGAQEGLRATLQELARARPAEFKPDERLLPASGADGFRQTRDRRDLLIIVALVGALTLLVLIVASANLANLVLSRSIGRVREFSVRAALGASRWRIFRLLLMESTLVAGVSAAGAVMLAVASARLFATITRMPEYLDFAPDWRLFVAGFAVALVAMLAFGFVPAWIVSRRDLIRAMKDGGQQTSAGLSRARVRLVFIAAQVAGCCALLVVAGAMGRGLQRLLIADPGFKFDRVVVLDPELGRLAIQADAARGYWADVTSRVAAHPDVEQIALVYPAPLSGIRNESSYHPDVWLRVAWISVEPSFFPLMEIPIIAGRNFEPSDDPQSVIIVSRRLATAMYGTLDVVGKDFPKSKPSRTIVGIAGDAAVVTLRAEGVAEHYVPLGPSQYHDAALIARARANPAMLLKPIQNAARAADSRVLPITHLLSDEFEEGVQLSRLASLIAALVGLLVLALACLGIFGVVAYAVTLRTKEMGIRRALGAEGRQVLFPLMRQLAWPVAVGMLLGVGLGMAAAHLFEGEPFYLASADAVAPMAALVVFGLTGLAAALVPASRALRADPVRALRHE